MATDEIARIENIEIDEYQVEEQMENIKKEAAENADEFDEAQMRSRVEATLQRQAVMDFLAENAELDVQFVDGEGDFDEAMMQKLAEESLAREQELEAKTEAEEEVGESPDVSPPEEETVVETVVAEAEEAPVEEAPPAEPEPEEAEEEADAAEPVAEERDTSSMSLQDKAFYALMDSGALNKDDA